LAERRTHATRAKTPAARPERCPICGKPPAPDYRPFCSKRCADVDLGRWLQGRYAVPGEPLGAKTEGDGGEVGE
jgi:endogenous inhibitor of DNA gyrase (YacG/DUF329 family)